MKPLNLISIVSARKDLSSPVFYSYLNKFGIKNGRVSELKDLDSFVNELKANTKELMIFDQYYFGFTINQISKEFDLLRLGTKDIVNIELKKENTGERIKDQLTKNRYYLSFLNKDIYSFTYVADDNILYYLDKDDKLIESDFNFLISILENQELCEIDDIQKLFDPTNYLVSPFNSTEAFMEGKYFLTDHQINIKKDILKLNSISGPCFIVIEGAAGTGKTLLAYDIAKEYIKDSRRVLIIHCGILNDGHHILIRTYGWSIIAAKDIKNYNLKNYDLVVIDEVQRMYQDQLDTSIETIKQTDNKCIFSYDALQCLSTWEINKNNPQHIKEKTSPTYFKLKEKIRTNKEIASFIKNLFDLSKINHDMQYSNIDVQYFSKSAHAKKHMNILKDKGWKIINYTPSRIKVYPYDEYHFSYNENAHEVIGQEYDNVVAVIDEHFYYKDDRFLSTQGWRNRPYYHPTKMLFQILTRTRKELTIIIINNELILEKCMKILQPK